MRLLVILLSAVLIAGCASQKPKERGASVAARTSLTAARSKIITAQSKTADLGRNLATARKELEAPTPRITEAIKAVHAAEADKVELTNALTEAQAKTETADLQVDALVQDNAKIAASLADAERDLAKELAAKKRWRLMALGLGAAILAFLAFKFGLPMLSAFA